MRKPSWFPSPFVLKVRGGSTQLAEDDQEEEDEETKKKRLALSKYQMDQQVLMQLRSTILSEELAKRGVPISSIEDISTKEDEKPPKKVDWDCAMSTQEEPKSCLISFDAELDTKVVAPLNTDQWVSLVALNRLRRTDPSKVEPMWHSKFAVLRSWFHDDSEYSMLQHTGLIGLVLHMLLDQPLVLPALLVGVCLAFLILCLPLWEALANRMLVSATLWNYWTVWARVTRAAFPLQFLVLQGVSRGVGLVFSKAERTIRTNLVELECQLLEDVIPLTVGPGSDITEEDEEEDDE